MITTLEDLQQQQKITTFKVISNNLQDIFNNLNKVDTQLNGNETSNGIHKCDSKTDEVQSSKWELTKILFWKRILHYKRNYRLLLCSLVLPVIFVIIAMGFMSIRPPGEFENPLKLTKDLYSESTELYSYESGSDYELDVYKRLTLHCNDNCKLFDSSQRAHKWIFDTTKEYVGRRYGGVLINQSRASVWYNNKGYHSMPGYLNSLSSALLKAEMEDDSYKITTYNYPMALGDRELSLSSM